MTLSLILMVAMGGVDALVFTGGIGENDAATRAAVLTHLAWAGVEFDPICNDKNTLCLHKNTSPVAIWIVPAEEERQIAIEATDLRERGE